MAVSGLRGRIQTVLGSIAPEALGVTLAHEHLVSNGSAWYREPEEAGELSMARAKVGLENLWWIRYHWFQCLDDLLLLDEEEAIEELGHFARAGGSSVIEMSSRGLGRDPLALVRISRATGLNIIMGSGYYVAASLPPGFEERPEEEIAEEIAADITEGVGPGRIRAGLIGEIGGSWPLDPREEKSLRAAVRAQKATGAYVNIHPGQAEEAAWTMVAIMERAGADLNRVCVSHVDRAVRERENRIRLLKTGVTLEYDLFGREGYYPTAQRLLDLPTDHQRINEIMDLLEAGYRRQILISQDIWNKHQRRRYGGWGYDHILRNAVPIMRAKGMGDADIEALLVENPKTLLTFP